jgi:ABC-2 type transport system ATP-binding protein
VPAAIETRALTKQFDAFTAVKDLDVSIEEGEVFGFLGPNGAGKTTSIRMIAGLTRPTSGEVWIQGRRVDGGGRTTRALVGLCPQNLVVWEHLTCKENLLFMADMYGVPRGQSVARVKALLEYLRLDEKANTIALKLSGGMKRRLNLALALVHEPPIVILDEPSAGLDPQSRIVVHDFIQDLGQKEGRTVILTTHEMDVADRLSRRVAIIDHGKLQVVDTPERLKNTVGEGDTVVLRLRDAARAPEAARAAASVEGVRRAVAVSREVRFSALNAAARLREVYGALEKLGIEVEDASLRKNTLEDVFISMTGRALREEGAG